VSRRTVARQSAAVFFVPPSDLVSFSGSIPTERKRTRRSIRIVLRSAFRDGFPAKSLVFKDLSTFRKTGRVSKKPSFSRRTFRKEFVGKSKPALPPPPRAPGESNALRWGDPKGRDCSGRTGQDRSRADGRSSRSFLGPKIPWRVRPRKRHGPRSGKTAQVHVTKREPKSTSGYCNKPTGERGWKWRFSP